MALTSVFVTIFRLFQFVSYVFTAFAFIKYNVLPVMRLGSDVAKARFATRHPEVHWPGRNASNALQSRLVTPVEAVGPLAPRFRNGEAV